MNSPPSLAWLNLWHKSTVDQKCTCILGIDPSWLGWEHEDVVAIKTYLAGMTPTCCLSQTIREMVDLAILLAELQGWTFEASRVEIVKTLELAIHSELTMFEQGYLTFYHARNRDFEYYKPSQSNLKSVNYSIFGNLGVIGECTLHYLCFNYSQRLEDNHNTKQIGLLELYYVPIVDLEDSSILYDSEAGDLDTGLLPADRLVETSNNLYSFNRLQARIVSECKMITI
ncbi:Hypothetical protein POVR2_LOCUS131 [uncultured virus]|nr:Hypothetical protein POVR2_LOCUS131 [uncultured virus]